MIDTEKKRARIEYYKTPRRQAYVKAYRRNNRDKFRGYFNKWYLANREKLSEMRANFHHQQPTKLHFSYVLHKYFLKYFLKFISL